MARLPNMGEPIPRNGSRENRHIRHISPTRSGAGRADGSIVVEDPRESVLRDDKLRQSSPTPKQARSTGRGLINSQMIRSAPQFAASGR
jgi:hypothetical protein